MIVNYASTFQKARSRQKSRSRRGQCTDPARCGYLCGHSDDQHQSRACAVHGQMFGRLADQRTVSVGQITESLRIHHSALSKSRFVGLLGGGYSYHLLSPLAVPSVLHDSKLWMLDTFRFVCSSSSQRTNTIGSIVSVRC